MLFWLLIGLLVAGIALIFVRIPAAYTIYSFFGLGVFGLYVVIDFNRLRRAGEVKRSRSPPGSSSTC